MSGYAKLWSSIVHSTVWRESAETKVVWITMIALADPGGYVAASLPGLADAARVSLEQCEAALARLKAPDRHSRTKEHEGRRIEDRDGGWILLNYRKHREGIDVEVRRAQNREAASRHRAKLAALRKSAEPSAPSAESAAVSRRKPLSAQAEAEGEAEAEEETKKKKKDTSASAHGQRSMQGASGQRLRETPAAPTGRSGEGKPARLTAADFSVQP